MIPALEVQAELRRILTSDHFVNAERLSAFLRFAVERTLAGEGAALKEYVLGTEVFGRGPEFDPRLDPVVRVEARRLRAKLQEYYETAGREDAVVITFRKGRYAPAFEPRAQPEQAMKARRTPMIPSKAFWLWAALALLVAGGAAGLIARRNSGSAAATPILVLPSANQAQDQPFAEGLGEAVTAELSRDPRFQVVAWPRFLEYRQRFPVSPIRKTALDLGVQLVLGVGVRRDQGQRRITAVLMRPDQGYKQWATEFERGLGDDFAVQREIARAIADELRVRGSEQGGLAGR